MKNILLLFLGILIALVSLEILLQTSSFVIKQVNKFNNHKIVKLAKNKNVIKILCIGESTTFTQYPRKLNIYLNEHKNKEFIVIDCGLSGTNLNNILNTIDDEIAKYKPDIVISMMGINDAVMRDRVIYHRRYNLKILELFRLFKKHISNMNHNLYAENIYFDIDNLTTKYMKSGEKPELLENMFKINPNNPRVLIALVRVYRIRGDFTDTEKYAQLYINNYLGQFDAFVPFALTDIYIKQKKYDLAKELIFKIITDKTLTEIFIDDYLCNIVESYMKFMTKDMILDLYNMLSENKAQTRIMDNLYEYLKKQNLNVNPYHYNNKFKNSMFVPYFNISSIKKSYLLFAEKVIEKNIVYICMGYPTMSINTFKHFFKDSKYSNKIIFVSNEDNFNSKLKKMAFFDLFVDNFAGTFGHCTKLGNTLIAENVGKTIIELVN